MQGMKKHKLLREDILPSMASNRKVQRLLNEFMDLLSEYEITEVNQDQRNSLIPKSSSQATNQPECGLELTVQMDNGQPKGGRKDSAVAVIDLNDSAMIDKDQGNADQLPSVEICPDTPMSDNPVRQDGQAKESDS